MRRAGKTFSSEWAIEVISLSKIFKDGENALKEVSFKMRPGEIQLWRLVNASIRAVTTLLGFMSIDGAAPEIRLTGRVGFGAMLVPETCRLAAGRGDRRHRR